jgi:hypothetical protein
MAKKKVRKAEEEDEDEFGPPPFDEKEFYSSELELSKATIVAALWGIMIAFITTAVFALAGDFYIGLAVGVVAALALKPMLDRLKLVTRQMETMKWLGMFFSYFMCWVAFWILLVNPPIMDLSAPVLKDRTPRYQELGSQMRLSVEVMENSGLDSITVEVTRPGGSKETRADFDQSTLKLYQLGLNYSVPGNYSYIVKARDTSGRESKLEGRMEIMPSVPPSIELIAPSNGSDITLGTPILLHVRDNALISGVHYTLAPGTQTIYLKYVKGGYQSYPSDGVRDNIYTVKPGAAAYKWPAGNQTMEVVATDAAGNSVNATYSFTLK